MVQTKLRPGGLMRCCIATLQDAMSAKDAEMPKEGDVLPCKYCKPENGGMIFRDGAWQWNRPKNGEAEARKDAK